MKWTLVWLLWRLCAAAAASAPAHGELRPGAEPLRVRAAAQRFEHAFALRDLAPSTAYEVRVSYPARTPCDFRVRVRPAAAAARELLNTAKAVFWSDASGRVPHTAVITGVADYDTAHYTVEYAVELDALVGDVLRETAPLVALAAAVTLLAVALLYRLMATIEPLPNDRAR